MRYIFHGTRAAMQINMHARVRRSIQAHKEYCIILFFPHSSGCFVLPVFIRLLSFLFLCYSFASQSNRNSKILISTFHHGLYGLRIS